MTDRELLELAAKAAEIVELTKERDGWRESSEEMRMLSLRIADQRDALKDAARLALDELERLLVCSDACTCSGREAIAALKAVL